MEHTAVEALSARPARSAQLRRQNLRTVLGVIVAAPGESAGSEIALSRAVVADRTGLTRATVSSVVDQLLAAQLVRELPAVRTPGAGRPAIPLVPATRTVAAVGLEVDVDGIGLRAVDLAGTVLDQQRILLSTAASPNRVRDALDRLLGEFRRGAESDGIALLGTCLALPGLVDTRRGIVRIAPQLEWDGLDVSALLADVPAFRGLPPELANEATVAATAEIEGLGVTGTTSFIYVSGGAGIGGAVVLDGRIPPTANGWSGEIGHLTVDPAGPRCRCGATGCLEQYAGVHVVNAAAGLPQDAPPTAVLAALEAGEPRALQAAAGVGDALGLALAGVVNMLDVATVVLGGHLGALLPWMHEPLGSQLRTRVLGHRWAPVTVRTSTVLDRPALVGAARTVLRRLLDDPGGWIGS